MSSTLTRCIARHGDNREKQFWWWCHYVLISLMLFRLALGHYLSYILSETRLRTKQCTPETHTRSGWSCPDVAAWIWIEVYIVWVFVLFCTIGITLSDLGELCTLCLGATWLHSLGSMALWLYTELHVVILLKVKLCRAPTIRLLVPLHSTNTLLQLDT